MKAFRQAVLPYLVGVLFGLLLSAFLPVSFGEFQTIQDRTATPTGVVNSNGTTAATIKTLTAGKAIFPTSLCIYNTNTTTGHTVTVLSSGGTVMWEFYLPALGGWFYDGRGDACTTLGESLQFKIDSGGTGTDCRASGFVVTR